MCLGLEGGEPQCQHRSASPTSTYPEVRHLLHLGRRGAGVPGLQPAALPRRAAERTAGALSCRAGKEASNAGCDAGRFIPAALMLPEGRWRGKLPLHRYDVAEFVVLGSIRPKRLPLGGPLAAASTG